MFCYLCKTQTNKDYERETKRTRNHLRSSSSIHTLMHCLYGRNFESDVFLKRYERVPDDNVYIFTGIGALCLVQPREDF